VTATTLLLIRHGETAWNAEHRIQGHLDIPLSRAGIRQAGRLAECLADEPIEAVYTSELARAQLTAVPLAERLGLTAVADTRLRERSFGVFEGLTLDDIALRYPEAFRLWRSRDPAWTVEDGESGQALIDRVLAALHDITLRHTGGMVAIVTHGGVLDVAYRSARRLPWDAPRQHQMLNAGINRLRALTPPLELAIVDWGDVRHLSESRDEPLS
jgi:probable phosphoglycerate mutase